MNRPGMFALVLLTPMFVTGCELMAYLPVSIADHERRKEREEERIAFHQREEARQQENWRAAYERNRDRPDRGRCPVYHQELSPIQPGDVLPAGRLCLARNSVIEIDPQTRAAQLLINLAMPTAAGELSYLAQVRILCDSDSLSVQSWRTFSRADAEGRALDSQVAKPPVRSAKSSAAFNGAVQAICKSTL